MKKKQLLKMGLLTSVAALALAGCGLSPKEQYTKAYKDIQDVKTAELATTISFNVETDAELDAETKEILAALNSVKISADTLADFEKKQYEANISASAKVGPMNASIEAPIFVDETKQKAYVKGETYSEVMNLAAGGSLGFELPEDVKGKVIAFDVEAGKTDKKLEEEVQKLVETFVAEIPEENFVKKDKSDVIALTFNGEKALDVVMKFVVDHPELLGEEYAGEEVTEEEFKEGLAEMKEYVNVGEVKADATIVDGKLAKEEISIPVKVTTEGQSFDFTLKVTNEYKNVNKPVKFTFDTSEDNVISQSEFEEVLFSSLTGGF